MKSRPLIPLIAFLCICQNYLIAQDKLNIKYGKITAADFDLSKHNFDTSVSAVVIADIGSSRFAGNNNGWFSLEFRRHNRIKILNKNGMDAANIEIPLYFDGKMEERVTNLKASTYTLDNGKVIETELDKKSVFKDKYDKNHVLVKFTLPGVKEGCIIEYSYLLTSDFLRNLQPWEFQGDYPVLWSEYEVGMPDFFAYVFLSQGSFQLDHKVESSRETYNILDQSATGRSEHYTLTANLARHKWIAQNVPALKTESYTSTIRNHISKIEFQLSQFKFPNSPVKDILGNWSKLATELMKDEDFGEDLNKNNNWLDDEMKEITGGATSQLEKTKKIYAYVRDRFTCTGKRGFGLSASLKTTDKNKNGYVADINMLLTAMLKHEKVEAYPVLLSTRSHGYTNEYYPLIDRFNYVVCAAKVDDKIYYLDASDPSLGFNRLPDECYNGHARMITNDNAIAVYFNPDSLREKKLTTVFLRADKAGEWEGRFTFNLGYYESLNIRSRIKEKGEDAFFKAIQSGLADNYEIKEKKVDRLGELDMPLRVEYDFTIKQEDDMIYFNPMMGEGYNDNNFKAAERNYPVEMPYAIDETYVFSFEVPAEYIIEEIPKSAKVNFGETDGFFEYLIDKTENTIRLRSRIKLNRTTYAAEEYNDLREFYSYVVKKHAESIVLKKKQ